MFLFASNAFACAGCSDCITKNYDLVANVTLVEESSEYKNAFNARIDKIISTNWQASEQPNAKPLSHPNVSEGDFIKIVETGIIPISSNIRRINSCSRRYAVGQKLFFFATEIQEGFFESDLCTCTQNAKKDS